MIGIIGAMDSEVNGIIEAMENPSENDFASVHIISGRIGDKEVCICRSGVGKVNAALVAFVMAYEYECEMIINTGIAGGLSPLKQKDIVLAERVYYHDVDVTLFGYEYGQIPDLPTYFLPDQKALVLVKSALRRLGFDYVNGTILSGDKFVTKKDMLKPFLDNSNIACEMEGAAIAHVCVKTNVPFISIRYISDIVESDSQQESYEVFERKAASNSTMILLEVLKEL